MDLLRTKYELKGIPPNLSPNLLNLKNRSKLVLWGKKLSWTGTLAVRQNDKIFTIREHTTFTDDEFQNLNVLARTETFAAGQF